MFAFSLLIRWWLVLRKPGRVDEADRLFRLALEIEKASHYSEDRDVQIWLTLCGLGQSAHKADRYKDAVMWFGRALGVLEGPNLADNPYDEGTDLIPGTLYQLALPVRAAGLPGDAEGLLRRVVALEMEAAEKANVTPERPPMATLPDNMGVCAREAGRAE